MRAYSACAMTILIVIVFHVHAGEARKPNCPFHCEKECFIFVCSIICSRRCQGHTGKNMMSSFPAQFVVYDHNKDGFISEREFIQTLRVDFVSGHAAMKIADQDGDLRMDKDEFDIAPFKKE